MGCKCWGTNIIRFVFFDPTSMDVRIEGGKKVYEALSGRHSSQFALGEGIIFCRTDVPTMDLVGVTGECARRRKGVNVFDIDGTVKRTTCNGVRDRRRNCYLIRRRWTFGLNVKEV